MKVSYLEFEKPLAELESKIAELETLSGRKDGPSLSDELTKLKAKSQKLLKDTYSDLSAWQKTQVARHPDRPHFSDFVENVFEDFEELAGDRVYGNDEAVIGGLARFKGRPVVIMGHEKGRTTEKRLKRFAPRIVPPSAVFQQCRLRALVGMVRYDVMVCMALRLNERD